MHTITRWIRQQQWKPLDVVKTLIVLGAIAVIPLLYAGLLTWSNIDPTGHLNAVPAAVVNLDEGNDDPELHIGDDLVDELLSSTAHNNFDWRQLSAEEARTQLDNGQVYAVLTIPADFSANAASVGGDDPQAAQPAMLTITSNDSTNLIAGTIARSVATEIADTLDKQVSDEYFSNIFASLTDLHDNLSQAATGADKLSDGTNQAADGADDLVVGLVQLRDGARDLDDGANRLVDGSAELSDGTRQLSGGASSLAQGADRLDSAAGQVAAGAAQVDQGAGALQSGIDTAQGGSSQLAAGLSALQSRTQSLPDAASQLLDGTATLASGASDLSDGVDTLAQGTSSLSDGAAALNGGMSQALSGATQLQGGLTQLEEGSGTLSNGAEDLKTGATQVSDGAEELLAAWDLLPEAQRKAQLEALAQGAQEVSQGATNLASGTDDAAKAITELRAGADALVGTDTTGLKALDSGAQAVADGASDVDDGAQNLATGAQRLSDGADGLRQAVGQLSSSTQQLVDAISSAQTGASALNQGIGRLSGGARELTDGTTTLAQGSSQLADGTTQLSTGAGNLADGAGTVDAGADRLASGTRQLADGSRQLADGTSDAASGAENLSDGLGELDSGAADLSRGLADGADKVPSYSEDDSAHLADVASRPVDLETQHEYEVASYGYGLGPYFMSLSLWVGALAFFLMFRPVNDRFLHSSMPTVLVAVRSSIPGAIMAVVQALLMVSIVDLGIGVEIKHLGQAYFVAILASLTFMMINQGLVALLGAPGRFLSLIFTVLQLSSAGATYPIETTPAFFQALHPFLPMTDVVAAFRSAIAGGPIDITRVVLVLSVYLVVAFVLAWLGVRARRHLVPRFQEELRRRNARNEG